MATANSLPLRTTPAAALPPAATPGNPEFLFADRTRSIGLISFEATALAFKAGRAVTMEPTYVVPAAG